jgi:uncharacterized membrane protein
MARPTHFKMVAPQAQQEIPLVAIVDEPCWVPTLYPCPPLIHIKPDHNIPLLVFASMAMVRDFAPIRRIRQLALDSWVEQRSPIRGEWQMSDLVVIAFPTEAKAEEVRQKLLGMQKEYLIELGDAVIAAKDTQGNIKLNQLINTTAVGAVGGTFWGALIGLIFLMPLAGAAIGAASGAISGALTDVGINNKFMKDTAAAIQPGTAALFVLVRRVTADKVLEGLKGEGGTVLKTSLDHTKEAALQAALAGVQAAVPASST